MINDIAEPELKQTTGEILSLLTQYTSSEKNMNNDATDHTNYISYFPGDISKEVSVSRIEEAIKSLEELTY
jgi:hypothetical protein